MFYFQHLNCTDILVDLPFLGGSRSVVDAISLGIPVVTIIGKKSEEKNANFILSDLDLDELIAKDIKEISEIIVNTIENYDILRKKISFSLSKNNMQKREDLFIKEFLEII